MTLFVVYQGKNILMVNIWRVSFGMKKEENKCGSENQLELNVVLYMVYCNVSCGSILLVLLKVESKSFSILHSWIVVDDSLLFWCLIPNSGRCVLRSGWGLWVCPVWRRRGWGATLWSLRRGRGQRGAELFQGPDMWGWFNTEPRVCLCCIWIWGKKVWFGPFWKENI